MANPPHSAQHQQLAVFEVRPYRFCAPADAIASIAPVPHVTPLPKAPPAVVGLVNHRGRVVQVCRYGTN
jgi:chemotaxis signal transduction protein